ncbi:GNAT family N-acetyltransferase [Aeromicrobium phragmitis]|uniref:GNAT family N-acetyltransferase n=1 Tax=Aeromicrobium phragmitis TaxID=2478914 RepID=A0A3L8PQZ2_9ACTN|nr:GNAT family N-acetyltransferase [Aeromicrobium phragmitis]
MITIEVRRPDAAELHAAGRLTVAAYVADGHLEPGDDYGDWLADTAARADDVVVATAGDEVLGAVTWCPPGSPHREVAQADDEGEFRALAVDPEHRGRGAARALVEACLQRGRELGLTSVWLCSLAEMTKAHRLYESLGFQRAPERDWVPHDAPDLVLLAFCRTL